MTSHLAGIPISLDDLTSWRSFSEMEKHNHHAKTHIN